MIIYKCIVSGDEMFSDIYKITVTDDGLFYEVEGKHVCRKTDDIDDTLIGGNASAEEVAEGTECSTVSGVDIVLNHHLVQTPHFDKKTFLSFMKAYFKALKSKLPKATEEAEEAFKQEATEATKKLCKKLNSDIEFFTGESMNPEGLVGFLDYREDQTTPYITFLKCGIEMEKC